MKVSDTRVGWIILCSNRFWITFAYVTLKVSRFSQYHPGTKPPLWMETFLEIALHLFSGHFIRRVLPDYPLPHLPLSLPLASQHSSNHDVNNPTVPGSCNSFILKFPIPSGNLISKREAVTLIRFFLSMYHQLRLSSFSRLISEKLEIGRWQLWCHSWWTTQYTGMDNQSLLRS